jgi:MFS family permease
LDKSKYKAIFAIVSGIVTAAVIFVLPFNVGVILLLLILIGIFTTAIGPVIFALTPSTVKSPMIALAYGLIFTCNNIGMFIGPSIAGYIRDISTYTYSFWFIGMLYFVMALFAITVLVWEIRKRRLTEQSELE